MIAHKLTFTKGNAKVSKTTAVFSLPAGWTCPAALLCMSRASKTTGKLTDGKACQFRCYAASAENLFKNVRISRWRNFELIRETLRNGASATADFIVSQIPKRNITAVRIHQSGDFFSQEYFDAWCEVARRLPALRFYAYTKALPFWVNRLGSVPSNLRLVASRGGKFEDLIAKHGLVFCQVVFSKAEVKRLGLKLDHDDSLAHKADKSFAILLHGTQPQNTRASKSLYRLRQQGHGGYQSNYFGHYQKKGQIRAKPNKVGAKQSAAK